MQVPGDRVAGAQSDAIDAARGAELCGGGGETVEPAGLAQPCHMGVERRDHLGRERAIALALLACDLRAGFAGKARAGIADRLSIHLPYGVVAVETEALGKPRHGGRLHPGLARLLAHREQRDVARPVEHVARGGLQLRRHGVERRDDPPGQGTLVHAPSVARTGRIATLVSLL